jgi:hypothetical protein
VYLHGPWRQRIQATVERLRRRHGFVRPRDGAGRGQPAEQLGLFP